MKVVINENKTYYRKRFWAGILLAQFLLFFICSKIDFVIGLFEKFFEFQKDFHQKLFSNFPFSVGDLFYIMLGILLLYLLFKIIKRKTRKTAVLQLLVLLNILYFIYQIFWGLLYFQRPIIEQLQKEKITLEETKALTLKYLELCKQSRNLVQEDQEGIFKITDLSAIQEEILKDQNKLPRIIGSKKGTQINSFKPSLYKGVMSYSGILGYYNPFTAEAQYNPELPPINLPFTLAHESSHQLGFAREQEANFVGYLIGNSSSNLELKYSAQYFVLRSLLNSLSEKSPDFVKMILENYSAGMKRDQAAAKIFVKKHEGFLDDFFEITNDLFLKSNQQEGSVTYSYFVELMILYERENVKLFEK